MELGQAYIIDAGWVFFAAWGMVLLALNVLAFGRDFSQSWKNGHSRPR